MGRVLAMLLGLAAMAGGVLLILFLWGAQVLDLIRACIPLILLFGGLIAFIAGVSSMKDQARAKRLEEETEEGFQDALEIETSELETGTDTE
jgi:small neutral amino acid transporter SnatA (MarC family)